MRNRMKAAAGAALAGGLLLSVGFAAPASAQQQQDGLINITIADNEFLNDVNIGVAAIIVANLCPNVSVGSIAVLGRAVDRSGDTEFVCNAAAGPLEFEQN